MTSSLSGAEYLHPAFANHLFFLACHRGTVEIGPDGVHVRSDIEGFSCWAPANQDAVIPVDSGAVRINSYDESNWTQTLRIGGYVPAETIRYMQRATGALPPTGHRPCNGVVNPATSEAGARAFARVQLDGFIHPDAANRTSWATIFEAVACEVWDRRDHRLYIVWQSGVPVAVGLTVFAAGTAGLYAVATHPTVRRRGLARLVLERAAIDANALGYATMVLQVAEGSDAERLYFNAGFESLYTATTWRRKPQA
jgi:GNAT superfamily N-acetyltransferase